MSPGPLDLHDAELAPFAGTDLRPDLAGLAAVQLEDALDARRKGLRIYESLKNLNEVIGTQYGDRVLFELVQNAHDAHGLGVEAGSGEIAVRLSIGADGTGELLVANRGRPFGPSNLDAIRNIGTSDKRIGEGIGNKGLGFRSVEALTDDVRILSRAGEGPVDRFDGYCFRFARLSEIKAGLLSLGASAEEAAGISPTIPRYLVPVDVHRQSDEALRLARDGFATVVALPLASADAIALAKRQVEALLDPAVPVLLFLDRIGALDVAIREDGIEAGGRRMTRVSRRLDVPDGAGAVTLREVVLDGGERYLLAQRSLPKTALLDAVRVSIPAAPPLTDPGAAENRWLREAMEAQVPVIYLLGIAPGRYTAIYPTFVADWSARDLRARIGFGTLLSSLPGSVSPPTVPERRYALRLVSQRLHQATFREAVLAAYAGRCAVSRLPEPRLLDAAHIVADGDDLLGQPLVANGLPLSKVHHAAFDANLIGIDPDYRIHVSEELLVMNDGPMLEQGIKAMRGGTILMPDRLVDRPDRDRLARRFEAYRAAS